MTPRWRRRRRCFCAYLLVQLHVLLVLCLNGRQISFGPPSVALSPAVLEQTYGEELIVLEAGDRAVVVQHHHHG